MSRFEDSFWVGGGFEELHRYMKQGSESSKDLETVLADRADLENIYANNLHKICKKAKKAFKRALGTTLKAAWQKLIDKFDSEEEVHRLLAASLSQDCCKPLKTFTELQVKQREAAVVTVEKQARIHSEKYKQQLRVKKLTHKQCRELEISYDQLEDMRTGKGKSVSEKDVNKLEKSCRRMEEGLVKTDREYREITIKTEEARLSWEAAMYKGLQTLESLEQERLMHTSEKLVKYSQLLQTVVTPTEQGCEELSRAAGEISADGDVEEVCSSLGTGPNQPEQLLMDCYEEDLQNRMDHGRRRTGLEKKIQEVEDEIQRQHKSKQGVESLSKVYQETPDFCDEKGQEEVQRQLVEADSMLNLLKANHYKLLCAHAEVSNYPQPSSQYQKYITTTRDTKGYNKSVLHIPMDQVAELGQEPLNECSVMDGLGAKAGRTGTKKRPSRPTGGPPTLPPPSYQNTQEDIPVQRTDSFDNVNDTGYADVGVGSLEFEDQGNGQYVCQCQVEFDYTANREDELTILPGDIINVISKQDEHWWEGELNGHVGIFPASYVQEM